jgi:hypothetical protein
MESLQQELISYTYFLEARISLKRCRGMHIGYWWEKTEGKRPLSNASEVPPSKKGKFQPRLLVAEDGQHLRMENTAL